MTDNKIRLTPRQRELLVEVAEGRGSVPPGGRDYDVLVNLARKGMVHKVWVPTPEGREMLQRMGIQDPAKGADR
jgi:hypothetical protein